MKAQRASGVLECKRGKNQKPQIEIKAHEESSAVLILSQNEDDTVITRDGDWVVY